MPRFSANISTLFQEVPLIERIGLAARHGFDGIEIQFPYSERPEVLQAELEKWHMTLVLMNFPAGDLLDGGEGLAAVPGCEQVFDNELEQVPDYLDALQPLTMNVLAGRPKQQHDRDLCSSVFQRNLRKAHSLLADCNTKLLIEPVNTVDMPDFFISSSIQAVDLITEMSDIELYIQYDIYHMRMMNVDVLSDLSAVINNVAHVQFSDVPGRTEPRGGIDFKKIFQFIDSCDYPGFVGAEYFPTTATEASLDWLALYKT